MVRILSLFSHSEREEEGYVSTIFEQVSWMDAYQFEQVSKAVAAETSGGRRPGPKQFRDQYDRLAQTNGWNAKYVEKSSCSGCGGIGMVYVYQKHCTTMAVREAVHGCPTCCKSDPGQTLPKWQLDQQAMWVQITREEFLRERDYARAEAEKKQQEILAAMRGGVPQDIPKNADPVRGGLQPTPSPQAAPVAPGTTPTPPDVSEVIPESQDANTGISEDLPSAESIPF
jgi:hypothetical protein